MIPQIIYIALILVLLTITAYGHGCGDLSKKEYMVNIAFLILLTLLLWRGGFFTPLFN